MSKNYKNQNKKVSEKNQNKKTMLSLSSEDYFLEEVDSHIQANLEDEVVQVGDCAICGPFLLFKF